MNSLKGKKYKHSEDYLVRRGTLKDLIIDKKEFKTPKQKGKTNREKEKKKITKCDWDHCDKPAEVDYDGRGFCEEHGEERLISKGFVD
jgi:hypothetical protein